MKKIFLALVFCLLFCSFAFSQEAKKLDEFGAIHCDDYLARMDSFQGALNNDPTAKGYIFIYEGNFTDNVRPHFGEAKAYERTMRRRMAFRRYDSRRIVFVKAGFREKMTVEFWIVPAGAEIPKPIPTLKKMKYRRGKPVDFCEGDVV